MSKRKIIRIVGIPAAIGASLVTGFAVAAFVMQGNVSASGQVANPTAPTATAYIVDDLWPGECNGVSVTFSNTNERPVVIDSITGSITKQPGDGNQGSGNDLVKWNGSSSALDDASIPAKSSATFTIPNAVCLSSKATNSVAGKAVTAQVNFQYEIPAGKAFSG